MLMFNQSPYSPDLDPADFFLFPRLKMQLKGHHFNTCEEIISESQKVLRSILYDTFEKVFHKWHGHWQWCVNSRVLYFKSETHA